MMRKYSKFSFQKLKSVIDEYLNLYCYYDQLERILCQTQPKSVQFQLDLIKDILYSKQFIEKVPPYINSLLTTTNIGIIVETLRILTETQFPVQKARKLNIIKLGVNMFTLHQIEKNTTYVVCDLPTINHVIKSIGIIATDEQFEYYCSHIWPREYSPSHVRTLQIYHLLELCVYAQTIQKMKKQLSNFLFKQNQSNFERNRPANSMKKTTHTVEYDENDEKMKKINIQRLKTNELIREVEAARKKNQIEKKNNPEKQSFLAKTDIAFMIWEIVKKGEKKKENQSQNERYSLLNGELIQNEIKNSLEEGKIIIVEDYNEALKVSSKGFIKGESEKKLVCEKNLTKKSLVYRKKLRQEPFMNVGKKIFNAK